MNAITAQFPGIVNLTYLNGVNGFKIIGFPNNSAAGWSVAEIDDINGDGITDLLIGAPGYCCVSAGSSYIIFGKMGIGGLGTINVSSLTGSNGFTITGFPSGSRGGVSVSGIGDINGDGITDIVIGAPGYCCTSTGISYVIFGKFGIGNSGSLNVSSLTGVSGFIIAGFPVNSLGGSSVSGIGDINHDGIADLIVGAPDTSLTISGAAYVIFGQSGIGNSGQVDVSNLNGINGFVFTGFARGSNGGQFVSGVGDVNQDGIADLIIGAAGYSGAGATSYVVFGKSGIGASGVFNVTGLNGANGFKIIGFPSLTTGSLSAVSGALDINNDGFSDLLIAVSDVYNGVSYTTGSLGYVIFGGLNVGSSGVINLSTLTGTNGFSINFPTDSLGDLSISGVGDINGDGIVDLGIGTVSKTDFSCKAYVIFGKSNIGISGSINLPNLMRQDGFMMDFSIPFSYACAISNAGDVNRDGISDLIMGAPGGYNSTKIYNSTNIPYFPSVSYVLFGENFTFTLLKNNLIINQGQTIVFDDQYLNATNQKNPSLDSIIQFELSNIQHGRFFSFHNPNIPLMSFLQQQVRNSQIQFTHDGSPWAPSYNVSVSYTSMFESTLPQEAKITFQLSIVLANYQLMIAQGQIVVLESSNLRAISPNTMPVNIIFTVADVTNGYFAYIDFPTSPILSFSQADIDSGQVEFVSTSSNQAPGISVAVSDGTATAGPVPMIITFADAPQILVNQITISQGGTQFLNLNHLHAQAPGATNTTLLFLVNDVHHGQFENYGQSGTAIGNFTQQQLINGNIQFVQDGSNYAPGYSITAFNKFGFSGSRKKSSFHTFAMNPTISAGVYSATSPAKIWFQAGGITLPQLKYNRLFIEQGGKAILSSQDILAIDMQGSPVFNTTFLINGLTHGQFTSVINPLTSYLNFTQSQIATGDIQFVHDGSANVPSYQVVVNQGPYFSSPYPASIAFQPIYSPPQITGQLSDQTVTVDEAFSFPLETSAFSDTTPLHFSASQTGGGQLPSWIHFDNVTNYFSGMATTLGMTSIQVTAKNAAHLTASTFFLLTAQAQSQATSHSAALIGGVVGGAAVFMLIAMRCYFGRKAQQHWQQALDAEATQKITRVLAKEIFEKVKFTGCFSYLSESNAKAYIKAIENIVSKLEPVDKTQQITWIDEIANQIKKQANKSFCYSFFKPEISPQELSDKAETIAQAAQQVLSADVGKSTTSINEDVEMSGDVRVLSA